MSLKLGDKEMSQIAASKKSGPEELSNQSKLNECVAESVESAEILHLSVDDNDANLNAGFRLVCSDDGDENSRSSIEELIATDEALESDIFTTLTYDCEANFEDIDESSEEKFEEVDETSIEMPNPDVFNYKAESKEDEASLRSILITGLSSETAAGDLKSLFNKHGKVVSMKVFTGAKPVDGEKKRYGYLTMSTSEEAAATVENLNKTEIDGEIVTLELTNQDVLTLLKESSASLDVKEVPATRRLAKMSLKAKKGTPSEDASTSGKIIRKEKDRDHRFHESRGYREYHHSFRRPFGFRGRGYGRGFSFHDRSTVGTFYRPFTPRPFFDRMSYRHPFKPRFMDYEVRGDRISHDRYREREMRESERHRESFDLRMLQRKHREEAYQLEREKFQLRIEREMFERERAHLLKLERQKQQLERETLEREREKLNLQRIREAQKRHFSDFECRSDLVPADEKRLYNYNGSPYPDYHAKPEHEDVHHDYEEPQRHYARHKYEPRAGPFERANRAPPGPHPDFHHEKDREVRGGSEHHVYKHSYSKESRGRHIPPRDVQRYPPPRDNRMGSEQHGRMCTARGRGGSHSGRHMPFY